MARRKSDPHAEESEIPRIEGNMIVLSRDAISGYKLRCGCEHEFMYEPGGLNSIETIRHPSDKITDMVKKRTAICPECQCLWNENAKFQFRPNSVHFSYHVTTEEDSKPQLVGVGRERSHCSAACHAGHEIKLSNIKYKSLIVTIITEEEFEAILKKIRGTNNLMQMSLLGALAGLDFSQILEEVADAPKKAR